MRATKKALGTVLQLRCHMNAYRTEFRGDAPSLAAPILIIADSDAAMRRAERTVTASGHRVGARLTLEDAPDRLEIQARAAAVWVELDEDRGSDMDQLLERISSDASGGRYGAIVAAPRSMIDPVDSAVGRRRRHRHRRRRRGAGGSARHRFVEGRSRTFRRGRRIRPERRAPATVERRGQPDRLYASPLVDWSVRRAAAFRLASSG